MFTAFKNYFDFTGRANRNEYWMYTLLVIIVNVGLQVLIPIFASISAAISFLPAVGLVLFALFTVIPSFSVAFRRLHDTGRSAWWLLLLVIPLIGALVLIFWFAMPGEEGENKYGARPEAN